ncbi:hypothetical protein [Paraburkholderia caledonica]|jgi:translation initiation factor 1 (eIF-1/SUI1)|uniref:hypothetical protein n=1 Tax=Paraburkholderia caledonica TaxID=134536 RepID=UPI000DEF4C84|nr:hypothetical protein [Paraburkholderia caledonica]AXF14136.1 hypothetical protein CUJ87_06690 [Paraburkholderia caledonica]
MAAPTLRQPTKKAFHFPKNSKGQESDNVAQAAPAEQSAADNPVPTKAAPKAKRAAASKQEDVKAQAEEKPRRARKEKVVRDSFTMPKSDYEKIAALKQKCLDAGISVKKSELLRAGLIMLEAAALKRLLAAVTAVEAVKTGRPAKG